MYPSRDIVSMDTHILRLPALGKNDVEEDVFQSTLRVFTGSAKANRAEVRNVLVHEGIDEERIFAIYQQKRTDEWFVEVDGRRLALQIADISPQLTCRGRTWYLTLASEETLHLRCHWLPGYMSTNWFHKAFSPFGQVMSVTRGQEVCVRGESIPNGPWYVELTVSIRDKYKIPHLIKTEDELECLVTFAGRPPLCLGCGCKGHIRASCPSNPSRRVWGTVIRDSGVTPDNAEFLLFNRAGRPDLLSRNVPPTPTPPVVPTPKSVPERDPPDQQTQAKHVVEGAEAEDDLDLGMSASRVNRASSQSSHHTNATKVLTSVDDQGNPLVESQDHAESGDLDVQQKSDVRLSLPVDDALISPSLQPAQVPPSSQPAPSSFPPDNTLGSSSLQLTQFMQASSFPPGDALGSPSLQPAQAMETDPIPGEKRLRDDSPVATAKRIPVDPTASPKSVRSDRNPSVWTGGSTTNID